MKNRAHDAAVGVSDLVEDETLTGREPDAQRPLLPFHEVARDLEARALGLNDLDRA